MLQAPPLKFPEEVQKKTHTDSSLMRKILVFSRALCGSNGFRSITVTHISLLLHPHKTANPFLFPLVKPVGGSVYCTCMRMSRCGFGLWLHFILLHLLGLHLLSELLLQLLLPQLPLLLRVQGRVKAGQIGHVRRWSDHRDRKSASACWILQQEQLQIWCGLN